MQTRSFQGSGEPAWVNASSNACEGLGPDPRRALGPADTRAASTGRTHDRTRPMLHQRKKLLSIRRRPHMTDAVEKSSKRCRLPLLIGLEWTCCQATAVLAKRRQLRDGWTHFLCWWTEQQERHSFQILDDCGQVEFVAGPR